MLKLILINLGAKPSRCTACKWKKTINGKAYEKDNFNGNCILYFIINSVFNNMVNLIKKYVKWYLTKYYELYPNGQTL